MAGTIASSAAYVTAKLAAAVGHASYLTALAIAKSLPGHKKKRQGERRRPTLHRARHTPRGSLVGVLRGRPSLTGAGPLQDVKLGDTARCRLGDTAS